MKTMILAIQVVVSILLVLSILLQQRGSGLSSTFGGTGHVYVSKRGAEKVLYYATLSFAVLFVINSLLYIFV